jgi:phosphatidylserine/phosphatidylglycerophosphate/cardiolipin synthase-like enzyme
MTDITGDYFKNKDLLQPKILPNPENVLKRRTMPHATVIKTIAEVTSDEESVSISDSQSVESYSPSISLPQEEHKIEQVRVSIKKTPFPIALDARKSDDSHLDLSSSNMRSDAYRSRSLIPTNRTDHEGRLQLRTTFSAGAPNKHIDVQDLDCKIERVSKELYNAIPIYNAPFETGLKKQLTSMIKGMTPSSERQVVVGNTKIALISTDANSASDIFKHNLSKARNLIDNELHSQTMPPEMIEARERMEREEENRERKKLEADQDEGDETWAKNLILPKIKGTSKAGSCECQVVRSAGIWSLGLEKTEHSIHTAYLHMIDQAEHFIYIENQFFISSTAGEPVKNQIAQALVERIKVAAEYEENFQVIVVMPLLPAFEGAVEDPASAVLRVQLYWEYQTIIRGANSIINQLKECSYIKDPFDYISFYGLRTHDKLESGPVTEIVYVHSKCMIIDDDKAIIGSANINDRSQLGRNDSEIAMIIKDKDKIRTVLNGMPRYVSSSVHKFRMKLFKEHSGIEDEEYLRDPLSTEFNQIWKIRAKENTEFYRHVFRAYPDDEIQSIRDKQDFETQAKVEDYDLLAEDIKGHLVEFPLNFLRNEDLRISIFNKEYYIPEENFV